MINSSNSAQFSTESTSVQYITSWLPRHIYQSPSVASMNAQELPLWYINTITNDSTGEVYIPATMNEITGKTNAVIDTVTGEKKEYRHLMKDPSTNAIWEPAMTTKLD